MHFLVNRVHSEFNIVSRGFPSEKFPNESMLTSNQSRSEINRMYAELCTILSKVLKHPSTLTSDVPLTSKTSGVYNQAPGHADCFYKHLLKNRLLSAAQ